MKIEDMISKNRADCSGCSACANICPKNCISMQHDDEGFLYPKINHEVCISCGRCDKVCPSLNYNPKLPAMWPEAFVAVYPDEKIRRHSSSGGVFTALSELILSTGGIIFGAGFDENWRVVHTSAENLDELENLRGSKYVQSQIGDVYKRVKVELEKGRRVLFSGTPCQIAAVRNMFPEDRQIVCIGVVCHGSIERDIWKAYLKSEAKRGCIKAVTMRDKSKGWLNYGLKLSFENGTEYITYRKENGYFLKAFTDGLLERDRCLDCTYKGDQIKADILLGDAWGMETVCPDLTDEWGLSGAICLTDIGRDLFYAVRAGLECREVRVETLIEKNQRIVSPAKVDTRYKAFRKKFDASPEKIQELCEQYEKPTIMNRISAKLRSMR